MAEEKDEKEYRICQSTVLKREGWTKTTLKYFKVEPIATAPNPIYSSASPVKIYSLAQIEEIEQSEEFDHWKVKTNKRKENARKSAATRARHLIEAIRNMKVRVKRRENTLYNAIDAYNEFHEQFDDYKFASTTSDKSFLDRITVNYIRHNLTSYEVGLCKIFGKTGKSTGYLLLNQKIFQRIAEVYPEYAEEAQRQFEVKFGVGLYELL